tara:strand:- start:5613 stop:7064 length:1452 start_codon:yes stop_codon:yes gene_type:complete
MAASTTTISQLLKNQYEGPIREQLNREALIYQLFEEGPHEWAGSNVHIPLHTAGISETTNIVYGSTEAQVVPEAGSQDYLELVVGAKALYASFAVTGKAEASAPGNAGGSEAAFIGAMYSEMKEMERDVRFKMERDMFTGRRVWGFLIDAAAGTAGGGGGVAHTERKVSGANVLAERLAEHAALGTVFYVKISHCARDTAVNWYYLRDATGGAPNAAGTVFKVLAVDTAKGTATIESTANAGEGPDSADAGALGDNGTSALVIEECNNAGARLPGDEVHGLNSLAFEQSSDGAFSNARDAVNNTMLRGFGYSMPRASAAAAAGQYSSGTSLDLESMQLIRDGIEDASAEDIDCVIMHRFTRAEYRKLFQEQIRFLPGETNAQGGHGYDLAFDDGIPLKVSKRCPFGVMYFIKKDTINTYTLRPGGFQVFTDNGDIITQSRSTAGATQGRLLDQREGFWKQYYELVCEKPRSIGALVGIKYKKA